MNRILHTAAQLKANPFLRMNAIFFIGSMAVAFLNYLYYPILGRLLPTSTFGELQVIVSSFMQMTIILNVLSMVSISILINEKNKQKAQVTIYELEKLSIYFGIAALAVAAILAGPLRVALKFESIYPFLAIAVVFIVTIPLTFRNAQLKAAQDFSGTSISGAIGAVAKLIFSVLLVFMALKTFGAIVGILAAQIAALLYTNVRAKRHGYHKPQGRKGAPDLTLLRPHLPYAAFVLGLSLITTLQVSIDVTVVKYLFDPETAGNYSAVATISRIIFFAIGSIVAVLLSSLDMKKPLIENRRVLLRSLGLATGIGGSIALVFCLFPSFVMHLLMGTRYDVLTHLLPLLSLSTLAASLVTLFTTYHIALHNYRCLLPIIIGALITITLLILQHSTLELVVTDILIGSTLMLIFVSFFTIITSRSRYHRK
ncbi:oligosaccharide flippase family protein [Candidatus Saccharibacteria bacterium]|nr:oligosaccharide flippase family protein [Candidatus Saccharibacteria bacterium]